MNDVPILFPRDGLRSVTHQVGYAEHRRLAHRTFHRRALGERQRRQDRRPLREPTDEHCVPGASRSHLPQRFKRLVREFRAESGSGGPSVCFRLGIGIRSGRRSDMLDRVLGGGENSRIVKVLRLIAPVVNCARGILCLRTISERRTLTNGDKLEPTGIIEDILVRCERHAKARASGRRNAIKRERSNGKPLFGQHRSRSPLQPVSARRTSLQTPLGTKLDCLGRKLHTEIFQNKRRGDVRTSETLRLRQNAPETATISADERLGRS